MLDACRVVASVEVDGSGRGGGDRRVGVGVFGVIERRWVTSAAEERRSGVRADAEIVAGCNVMVYESNLRGETIWAARTTYLLRRTGGDFKMARKTVALVNNDKPLYTLSFLI